MCSWNMLITFTHKTLTKIDHLYNIFSNAFSYRKQLIIGFNNDHFHNQRILHPEIVVSLYCE